MSRDSGHAMMHFLSLLLGLLAVNGYKICLESAVHVPQGEGYVSWMTPNVYARIIPPGACRLHT